MNKQQIVDYTPIGEIKFVPKNITPFGYIEYVPGETFSAGMYPELYKVLDTNTFPPLLNKAPTNPIPLGTMIYSLSHATPPNGYKVWEYSPGNLEGTDILEVFEEIYRRLPYSDDTRTIWREAIDNRTFPRLPKNFFIRALQSGTLFDLGSYKPEALNANAFNVARFSMPATVTPTDEFTIRGNTVSSQTLTPLSEAIKELPNIVTSKQSYVYGVRPSVYEDRNPTFAPLDNYVYEYSPIKADVNISNETTPNALHCIVLVKVNNDVEKVMEDSFKPVIRAYHSIDVPLQNVELALSTMTKVYEDTHENVEEIKSKISDIQNTISTLDTSVLPEKIAKLTELAKSDITALIDEMYLSKKTEFEEKLKNELDNISEKESEYTAELKKKYTDFYNSLVCLHTQIKKYSVAVLDKYDVLHSDSKTIISKIIRDEFDNWAENLTNDVNNRFTETNKNIDDTRSKLTDSINETDKKLSKALEDTDKKLTTLIEDTAKDIRQNLDNYKKQTDAHLQTVDNRLDALENSVRALEQRLAQKIPAITHRVPNISEKSAIPTSYFGKGGEYLGTPSKWCIIDDANNLAFPAYILEEQ